MSNGERRPRIKAKPQYVGSDDPGAYYPAKPLYLDIEINFVVTLFECEPKFRSVNENLNLQQFIFIIVSGPRNEDIAQMRPNNEINFVCERFF